MQRNIFHRASAAAERLCTVPQNILMRLAPGCVGSLSLLCSGNIDTHRTSYRDSPSWYIPMVRTLIHASSLPEASYRATIYQECHSTSIRLDTGTVPKVKGRIDWLHASWPPSRKVILLYSYIRV